MASGAKVDNECKTVFNDVKLGRKYRYVIFGFNDTDLTTITVLKKADPSATYADFTEDLKAAQVKQECRYAVFDAEYQTSSGGSRNKILFFMWSPEDAKTKQKMVYSASKDALKKCLGEGIGKEVQANDYGDLAWNSILEIIMRTERD
jgi:cofilin